MRAVAPLQDANRLLSIVSRHLPARWCSNADKPITCATFPFASVLDIQPSPEVLLRVVPAAVADETNTVVEVFLQLGPDGMCITLAELRRLRVGTYLVVILLFRLLSVSSLRYFAVNGVSTDHAFFK